MKLKNHTDLPDDWIRAVVRAVWGARGQFSERDADAYALQALRKYRRGELEGLK